MDLSQNIIKSLQEFWGLFFDLSRNFETNKDIRFRCHSDGGLRLETSASLSNRKVATKGSFSKRYLRYLIGK